MRILLCTGKGGVGKTTLAAATGAALAARGRKTLVVSTDPAHSLGDAFGSPLGAEPSEVDTLLSAVQVDSRTLVDSTWERLRGELRAVLAGAGLDTLDAESPVGSTKWAVFMCSTFAFAFMAAMHALSPPG